MMQFRFHYICLLMLLAAGGWAQSGNQLELNGKSFNLMNHDENGTQQTKIKDGALEYLKSVGDVELHQGEDLVLYCRHLEYFADKGQLQALRWDDKPLKVLQAGTTAYADRLEYDLEAGLIVLTGNASVIKADTDQVREIYGERIVRKTNEETGNTHIHVEDQPLMKSYPTTDALKLRSLEPEAEDGGAAGKVSGTLGNAFELRADPAKGEFNIDTDAAGAITRFTALRGVVLRSEKMDLDCHRLDLLDDGAELAATGTPVILRQGEVHADCHRFRHIVADKQSVLTGFPPPRIHQREGDRVVTSSAPLIRIREGASGEMTIDWLTGDYAQQEKNKPLPEIQFRDQKESSGASDQPKVVKIEPGA